MKSLPVWLSLLLCLPACSRTPVMLDALLVHNATPSRITEVTIRHEPTRRYGAVNAILPQKSFHLGVAGKPMLGRTGVVRWRDGDGRQWSVPIDLPYDRTLAREGRPMILIYVISPNGQVAVRLREAK